MISADLGQKLEGFVRDLVVSGRYDSKGEVLSENVRLVQEREAYLAALDASIARSFSDIRTGQVRPADDVFDCLERKYQSKTDL